MPSPNLGSVAGGMIDTQLDLQAIQRGQQDLALGQYKLAEAPIKLQEEQIQLQKDKFALAQQMRMFSLMQNVKPPRDNSPQALAESLMQTADMYMSAGMPDAAAKAGKEASTMLENASKVDSRNYRIQNDRLSRFANILDSAEDSPSGFQSALAQMVTSDPGAMQDPKFRQLVEMSQRPPGDPNGWRPGLVTGLKAQALTLKEAAEVNYRNKQAIHAEAAARDDEARLPLIRAQTQKALDQDAKIRKEGGDVPVVKPSQLQLITDLAKADYPSAPTEELRVRARPLAREMITMARSQNITMEEAATRVYNANRSAFGGLKAERTMPGSKPDTPLTLPPRTSKMTLEEWTKKLKKNQYYPQGLWDGAKFVPVAMGAKAADEEDDEDED